MHSSATDSSGNPAMGRFLLEKSSSIGLKMTVQENSAGSAALKRIAGPGAQEN